MEAWDLSCLLFIINSKMEEKSPLDLVGLGVPWGSRGDFGQVEARFSCCTFMGGRIPPKWLSCRVGPRSAWVSEGNSLRIGEVEQREKNVFVLDKIFLLLDLDFVKWLCCLIQGGDPANFPCIKFSNQALKMSLVKIPPCVENKDTTFWLLLGVGCLNRN